MNGVKSRSAWRTTIAALAAVGTLSLAAWAGPATTLVVSGVASPIVAGTAGDVTVTAQDSLGNTDTTYAGTVHFTSTDLSASLPGDYTFRPSDNGTHTFTGAVRPRTVGSLDITATDTMTSSITGSQTGINVVPLLVVTTTLASPDTAGTTGDLTVTAIDGFGDTVTNYLGTVHFTSTDANAVLPADYTFQAGDGGTHTFPGGVRLEKAGTQTVSATDTVTSLITGTSAGVTVVPAATSALSVTGLATPYVIGGAGTVTVTATDQYGNTNPGYVGTVHFTSTDAAAVLPADYTFTGSGAGKDNGVHAFTAGVTLNTLGTQSVTATDTVTPSITGSQTGIEVIPNRLLVAGFVSPAVAGTAGDITVTAVDALGNTLTTYLGTVHFTSTDPSAVLPGDYTFQASDNGTHTFSGAVTLNTVGTQSVTATDTVTAAITGSQTGIEVIPDHLLVAGFPPAVRAGSAGDITVTAVDALGNTLPTYLGTVHFTSTDPAAVLPADYTFTAGDGGTHTFLVGVTLNTLGTQSVTATDTVDGTITGSQAGIDVIPLLVVTTTLSSPDTAGTAGDVTVTAKDSLGATVTGYLGTVDFTTTDPAAELAADYTFTAGDGGTHTFPGGVTLKTAGPQTVTATDTVTSLTTGTSAAVTVVPAATTVLAVTGLASPYIIGGAGTVTVTAMDQYGNTTPDYVGTVHFTSTDPAAVLPADYTFTGSGAGNDNGVHVFAGGVTLNTLGTQTITATDTVAGTITGSQAGIDVIPQLVVTTTLTSPDTTGTVGDVTVAAKDALDNLVASYLGTVHFTSTDPAAVLPADYTFLVGDGGTHTFPGGVTLNTPGGQSITATDTVDSAITGTQPGINVIPVFVVSGFASPATAGVAGNVTVTAQDSLGNTYAAYAGTVHFTSSDPQAVLPADTTLTNGTGTFSVTLDTAGTQSITATDTVDSAITGSQTGITVNAAAAAALAVAGFASPATAGVAGSFTVTAEDAFGNTTPDYTGTVHFTSSDGTAVLPADYTFVSGDAGVHTFSATLYTAGTQSLTATDTVTSSITGTQAGITVGPAAAASLVVEGFPTPATAGMAGNFTVRSQDAFGNTATGYTGTVHFTSTDALASVPADYTFVSGDAGVHTFSATLRTAGTQSLTATDTVTSSITGTQGGITVGPAAAASLAVEGFPTPITAGVAGDFSVTAKDAFGNTATGYTGTVHFTSSDPQAALPADYTFVGGDPGVHTFSATLYTAGTQSLTATDTVTSSITGTQSGIAVGPAAPVKLAVKDFPTPATAGVAGNFTVTATDAFGNTTPDYLGTVHFTSSDPTAVLPADYTFVSGDAGVHDFGATLKTAGTQSLTATDTVTSSITGTQAGITVSPAAASSLVLEGFSSPATAGVPGNFTVRSQDAFGNTATGYRGTVHFTSSDPAALLPADYTFVSADAGVHSFQARLRTAGTQSLTATDKQNASLSGTQAGIQVNAAGAGVLAVAGFPSPAVASAQGTFTVTAKDVFGNVAVAYQGIVHFTSSDPAAQLPVDYAFQSGDAGSHTFSAALKTLGTQSITVTDRSNGALLGSQTGIKIVPVLAVAGFPSPATAGVAASFTVTAQDGLGNVALAYAGTVHFTSSDPAATLPADYTFVAGDSGMHTFNATLQTTGVQSITATDTAVASVSGTQAGITVTPAAASILAVAGFPSPTTVGTAGSFTVTATDSHGNTDPSYAGTVHFSSTDSAAQLPGDYTFVSADAGAKTFTATFMTAGTQSLTATDKATPSISGTQSGITVHQQVPVITSALQAAGTVGSSFSYTITAAHSPASFGAANRPDWMLLNTATGQLFGTPTAVGTTQVTISASNAGGAAYATLSVTVTMLPPAITSAAIAAGSVGHPFQYAITASQSPSSFDAAGLPDGLAVSSTSGLISGTPARPGKWNISISAANSGGTATASVALTVYQYSTDVDSDGDGFPDLIEIALGTNPNDPNSTPLGGSPAGTPQPLSATLAIKLDFARPANDSLLLSGTLPIPAGFVLAGRQVTVAIGGVVGTFTLNASGSSPKGANDSFKLAIKSKRGTVPAQMAKFTAKFSRGDYASLLVDEGLTSTTVKNAPRTVPVTIFFDQVLFKSYQAELYTAKTGKVGQAKQAR